MEDELGYDTQSLMEARQLLSKMAALMKRDWFQAGNPEDWMPVLKEYEDYVAKVRANGK